MIGNRTNRTEARARRRATFPGILKSATILRIVAIMRSAATALRGAASSRPAIATGETVSIGAQIGNAFAVLKVTGATFAKNRTTNWKWAATAVITFAKYPAKNRRR